MSKGAWIVVVASGLVLTIFGAGFIHGAPKEGRASAERNWDAEPIVRPAPAPISVSDALDEKVHFVAGAVSPHAYKTPGLLAMTGSPEYRRAAEFSLKVEDCTKAEDTLESKLQALKGEILDMVMEGTEGSRTCTLSVLIPADKFRAFIGDVRGMGKVQSERITASKVRPGGRPTDAESTGPDPRELSLVSIRMADEKVAQTVLQSRGVLASSFDQAASHFMNGVAVLVEALGYMLPYTIVIFALVAPLVVVARIRRARQAACQS